MRLVAVALSAASVVAGGATGAGGVQAEQEATAEMRSDRCVVRPAAPLVVGQVRFVVVNRSRRARRFSIGGRRTAFVARGRRAVLRVSLRAGVNRFTCAARGRPSSVHSGAVAVQAPPPAPRVARIGVRGDKFFDRVTEQPFVPRGSNYIRLGLQTDAAGHTFVHHSTFDVGRYDPTRTDAALARMRASGYNVVRVFFSPVCLDRCLGDPLTRGLRRPYLQNVADFVTRAKAHDIQVMLTIDGPPAGTVWSDGAHRNCCELYAGMSQWILPAESVAAFREFHRELIGQLLAFGMPADGVFAYSLINEVFFDGDKPPFSLRSGTRTTANGRTYDLSSGVERRRMLEEGLVYWTDEMVKTIHAVVPTALVTIGAFHAHEPNLSRPGDPRLIYTNELLGRSSVDFFDFHPYPGLDLTFPQFMQNYGVSGAEAKPVVMGEYGAFRFAFGSAEAAASALVEWQRRSCAYGFDGWLLWTWDTHEQRELWNGLSKGGVIERALSPKERPDPCG